MFRDVKGDFYDERNLSRDDKRYVVDVLVYYFQKVLVH